MIHELKTWPEYFAKVFMGEKNFEVRKNDREFKSGDILHLREWDNEVGEFTGRALKVAVCYILYGGQFGIEDGYCVMGFREIQY